MLVSGSGLGLDGTDESFNETLADHRTGTLTTVAEIGSQVGGAPVLPIIVGLIALVCAFTPPLADRGVRGLRPRRRVGDLPRHLARGPPRPALASTAWKTCRSTPATPRATPPPRSRSTPAWCCCSPPRFTSSLKKALAWTAAILLTTFVAFSRMYDGMHHPLDVAGGVLVGIGAILVLLFACRAAGAAAERRSRRMKVAVVAHAGKTFGGGLPELRRTLDDGGRLRAALERGAEEQAGAARRSSRRWRRAPS